jgi:hypothetical protein
MLAPPRPPSTELFLPRANRNASRRGIAGAVRSDGYATEAAGAAFSYAQALGIARISRSFTPSDAAFSA